MSRFHGRCWCPPSLCDNISCSFSWRERLFMVMTFGPVERLLVPPQCSFWVLILMLKWRTVLCTTPDFFCSRLLPFPAAVCRHVFVLCRGVRRAWLASRTLSLSPGWSTLISPTSGKTIIQGAQSERILYCIIVYCVTYCCRFLSVQERACLASTCRMVVWTIHYVIVRLSLRWIDWMVEWFSDWDCIYVFIVVVFPDTVVYRSRFSMNTLQ